VLRWNQPDGSKAIRPLRRNLDGTWAIGALSEPRSLYRLPAVLAAGAETPVVVAEGEKTVDAAWQCGLVGTTSAGGAGAANKTDWQPLAGRRVVILPDNDEPGEQYAEDVAQLVLAAGAKEVRVLRLVDFAKELPVGGDLADVLESPTWCGLPLADGAGLADVGQWILATAESIEPWRPSQPPNPWRGNPTRRKFCRNLFGNSWK